jgi:hypothetical protein
MFNVDPAFSYCLLKQISFVEVDRQRIAVPYYR